VSAALKDWQDNDKTGRLWARDAYLWSGSDEAQWLDWLTIVQDQLEGVGALQDTVKETVVAGFRHLVLLGMGGSSLCPDVLRETFGHIDGHPELLVLDSTDPAQVASVAGAIDMARTLFIVSSKSGSTLEPNILLAYFLGQVADAIGEDKAASRFIAITDPGSDLERLATGAGFRHIFHGKPQIGGRFSALSAFGVVPAVIMGLHTRRFLKKARHMVEACSAATAADKNPGVLLGTILGIAAIQGRDKMTLFTSPGIASLGGWLEQLVAESTGKIGKGIIPVDGERIAAPERYGDDRIFVYLRLESAPDTSQDAAVAALEAAGQPVVRIPLADPYRLGAEFFRWEIATAVAGAILGINPFDQPDVEASKVETRKLTNAYEASGSLPAEHPLLVEGDLSLYTNHRNAEALFAHAGTDATLAALINAHLARAGAGDYVALLAYLARNAAHDAVLTPPARPTRAGPTAVSSCRSPAITPMICRCRVVPIHLVPSRPPRRVAISRCWPSASGGCCACISAVTCRQAWRNCSQLCRCRSDFSRDVESITQPMSEFLKCSYISRTLTDDHKTMSNKFAPTM
jgi:transaldolase/glucose-6-phosphate isomerase